MPIPLWPDLIFAAPGFLWLLPLAFLIAFLGGRRGEDTAIDFGAARLLADSVPPTKGRFGGLASPLFALAAVASVVALARPQRIDEYEISTGEGIEIMIAIDVSWSMSARDYVLDGHEADRLEAARSVVGDFIEGRPNDRIGLTIFAGRPHHLGPLTMDHDWLHQRVDEDVRFYPNEELEQGTAIGTAIAAPARKLAGREAESRILVLITDGSQTARSLSPKEAAKLAATLGIKVYPIAIGTPGEHYVPLIRRTLPQTFDLETLEEVAEITGGRSYLGKDTEALRRIFAEIDTLEKSEIERRTVKEAEELFQWPAATAAALVLAGLCWSLGPGRVSPD